MVAQQMRCHVALTETFGGVAMDVGSVGKVAYGIHIHQQRKFESNEIKSNAV